MATSERSDDNDGCDQALQPRCGICCNVACEPVVTDKCCNQIYCSECLKKYLEHNQDNYARPCPHCKMEQFTYMPLSMKVLYMCMYLFVMYQQQC